MAPLAHRAAYLSLARLANYGLMLVSPIILTRVLSVEDFGRYREFLLYGTVLQSLGGFAIYDSLLYFVPAHPESPWRIVRQTAVLTFGATLITSIVLVVFDLATGGAVVGVYLWQLVLYLMLTTNLDFWEMYWLANHRSAAMFGYSAGRLIVRLLVVTLAATATRDVATIIWSLIAVEGLRLVGSAVAFAKLDAAAREPLLDEPWRGQLRFCLPSGTGSFIANINRYFAGIFVTKMLGAASLAQYAIGRFPEPVIAIVRNALSTVVLPEMVRRGRENPQGQLSLWRRATAMNAVLLLPVIVLVIRYAEPAVTTVFGHSYAAAAPLMQIFMFSIFRECFDFAPALRAMNRTSPLVYSNLAALVGCAVGMVVLVPRFGVNGAMAAAVLATYIDGFWQARSVANRLGKTIGQLIPWSSITRSLVAAVAACVVVVSSIWTDAFGFAGVVFAGATYMVAYMVLLKVLRVPEAEMLFTSVWRTVAGGSKA
ncbi:MAG: lipopolysaccharide biosynthesis protein [Gammaproteobacteria bacterium]